MKKLSQLYSQKNFATKKESLGKEAGPGFVFRFLDSSH
jgi:hypothetical protein